ncbi:hypothetical protein GCM10010406_01980 [Streptomyces thermolineatus]|uniref:Uncharacterized protein n=1 Tax=Streptomyces thermolineatus TaxID=44033 RepID=A0ABN3KRI4_9ACTN
MRSHDVEPYGDPEVAVPADLLVSALSNTPEIPESRRSCDYGDEVDSSHGSPEPPLTSEPAFAEDTPLTSEAPLADEVPLTSEPPAVGRMHADESWSEELTEPMEHTEPTEA